MNEAKREMTRRAALKIFGAGTGALALSQFAGAAVAQQALKQGAQPAAARRLATFTGPGANPYWNSVGPLATYPRKAAMVLLTDRPVQLETPRHYFLDAITPNDAFFVRWHLEGIPNEVDLKSWRLRIEGNVATPLELSFTDLMRKFEPVTFAAVNQCSGNSRSRFTPRVAGGQWGNGAMGCARWTGARFRDVLKMAGVKASAVQVQMQGLERGKGPQGKPSFEFMKSLDLNDPVLDECIIAYAMNGEPLPMLNGFPARLVVPGYFATYWVKCLSWVRLLDKTDENFWMNPGYRVPETPRGTTTPEDVKAGKVKMIPITRMPVRSFVVSPDGATKIPAGMPVSVRGIGFSGAGRVSKVEFSHSAAGGWREAKLGEDLGPYAFRTWEIEWRPEAPGRYSVAARATDEKGNVQPDEGVWNPGGYLWNKIERQEVTVGVAS
ncbi:MAG TPA: molybdopterin-dependent oxidoreductase [Candidatus Acidoferrales bacterium]|nr:molybdopterin-dependent oxidoreductase [Candidatus Acidoferrales bacterium]